MHIKNRNPKRAKQSMLALIDEALNFIEDKIVKQEKAQEFFTAAQKNKKAECELCLF